MPFFDLFDKLFSFADPSDEEAQDLVNAIPKLLFNTMIKMFGTNKKISSAQEVQVDTLPTYTGKLFDERIANENAVLTEGDTDLTDEPYKAQLLWSDILHGLASDE